MTIGTHRVILGGQSKEILWDKNKDSEYVYYAPFAETPVIVFLKTIIPSRKATKYYLRGN